MSLRHIFSVFTVGVVLLTGCSSEADEPAALPTKTPIPTVGAFTESPDPEAEAEPEPETAKQYIVRWAATSQQMQVTGDSGEFRRISAHCRSCLGLADRVDRIYRQGGYVKTKGWVVKSVSATPSSTRRYQAFVSMRGRPTEYRASRDGRVLRLAGGPRDYRFVLRRAQDEWSVLAYYVIDES